MKKNDALVHLLNLLEDEFSDHKEVKVRPVFPSGIRRAVDLPQDYDPESSALHNESGIMVYTPRKEYFFPVEMISPRSRAELDRRIHEIRESL